MDGFSDMMARLLQLGYTEGNVEEKLAQDLVLAALDKCGYRDRLTIKGGVVMANLSKDVRRATLDLDLDFMHYPLTDETIDALISAMNNVSAGIEIIRVGDIMELKQQDYSGKRVYLSLQDGKGGVLQYKLDIGVHTQPGIGQVNMEFDLAGSGPAELWANGPEQVFAEKLKSLLRLGTISNRAKDMFDMVYLIDRVDRDKLPEVMRIVIYDDKRMMENDIGDVLTRLSRIFADATYMARLAVRRTNWLAIDPKTATGTLLKFLATLA